MRSETIGVLGDPLWDGEAVLQSKRPRGDGDSLVGMVTQGEAVHGVPPRPGGKAEVREQNLRHGDVKAVDGAGGGRGAAVAGGSDRHARRLVGCNLGEAREDGQPLGATGLLRVPADMASGANVCGDRVRGGEVEVTCGDCEGRAREVEARNDLLLQEPLRLVADALAVHVEEAQSSGVVASDLCEVMAARCDVGAVQVGR